MVAHRLYWRANEEAVVFAAQENSHFIETLRGMPSIKSLGIERRRQGLSGKLSQRTGECRCAGRPDRFVFNTLSTGLFGIDRILIIVIGAHAVMANTLTVGMLVAFLAYKDQFSQRLSKLLDTLAKLAMLSMHGERIADIALAEPETLAAPAIFRSSMPMSDPVLSAREIHFRYAANEPEIIPGPISMSRWASASPSSVLPVPARPPSSRYWRDCYGRRVARSRSTVCRLTHSGLSEYRAQIGCVLQDDRCSPGRSPTTSQALMRTWIANWWKRRPPRSHS